MPIRTYKLTLGLVLIVAIVLRVFAAFGELWFDEIVSLWHARSLSSPLDVLLIFHDNNHPLNTVFLFLVGPNAAPLTYRLLAIISGTLLLIMLPKLTITRDELSTVIAAMVFGFSFIFVLYSSEARGYAPMLLFAALAYITTESCIQKPSRRSRLIFTLAHTLGILSHPAYLQFYFAVIIWSAVTLRSRAGTFVWLTDFAKLHLPALCISCIYYWSFVLQAPVGSGPKLPYLGVILNALSLSLAGPEFSDANLNTAPFVLATAILMLYIAINEIHLLYKKKDQRWCFFLAIIFLAPIISLLVFQPRVLFERYFLVSIFFSLILFSNFIARLTRQSGSRRILGVIIFFIYIIANCLPLSKLLSVGRGGYKKALQQIVANSTPEEATFSSDHDGRAELILNYNLPYLGSSPPKYVKEKNISELKPTWYLSHSQDSYLVPPKDLILEGDVKYQIDSIYPYASISGWSWFLYRKVPNQN